MYCWGTEFTAALLLNNDGRVPFYLQLSCWSTMLSVNKINIQPGFTRVVLLVINLYAILMTMPVFPLDNVSHGIAKPGETGTDVLLWKKTRRREASISKPTGRRCPVVVCTVTLLLCIWQFTVQIRPCSLRLVYSSQWLVELALCFSIGVVGCNSGYREDV